MISLEKRLCEIYHTINWTQEILNSRLELLASAETPLARCYYQEIIDDARVELCKQYEIIGKLKEQIAARQLKKIADRRVITVESTGLKSMQVMRDQYDYEERSRLARECLEIIGSIRIKEKQSLLPPLAPDFDWFGRANRGLFLPRIISTEYHPIRGLLLPDLNTDSQILGRETRARSYTPSRTYDTSRDVDF